MSYLVLARKWRPRRFAELVGQEHVVRALCNALDSGRVHHAFLFTGTRGVGKTTIARIFAKSLNCERGIGAEPCGECAVCTAVDAGRFVDLIEIDAASNTGVDDVREVIENAQYMPTRGRYKVYLVDEVHMLSKNAFNALLKTLEEPPEHVKFLLATTDPQKLPVTVLSRCLQFNLKRLTPEQISGQIETILAAEGLDRDQAAVRLLAHAADGSLRDGLSLLDQAIAYGAGQVREADVATMLGTVDQTRIDVLMDALAGGDGSALLAEVERLAGFAPDYASLLDALAARLHRIQLAQLVPEYEASAEAAATAARAAPELIQLWYQMALSGRRELPLAPNGRIGFEMVLLRMLAFRPEAGLAEPARAVRAKDHAPSRTDPRAAAPAAGGSRNAAPTPSTDDPPSRIAAEADAVVPAASPVTLTDNEDWLALAAGLDLRGPIRELANHASLVEFRDGRLKLGMAEAMEHLRTPGWVRQLAEALAPVLGATPRIDFVRASGETLHTRTRRGEDARQADAERAFAEDPAVQRLVGALEAKIVPGSVRPLS